MRKIYTLLILFVCSLCYISSDAQERFLDEVFTDVETTTDVIYGANTTVLPVLLGGTPTIRPLNLNFIEPAADTMAARPLILMFHTGNFLPQLLNGNIHGTIDDGYVVSLCERLARMGYAVAMVDYRLGWNPLSTSQQERTETLINAAYRGVQDATTCARFFRMTADQMGNPFAIDPDRIAVWGVGTGGYISFAASTLDQYTDVVLPKFIGSDVTGDGIPDPMVLAPIHGDPFATTVGVNPLSGDTLCFPNHVGYSSEFQLCVNMGGALGDTSWVDASDPPMISFHVPTDPFAPYTEDLLIVPTTGELVVEVQGSYLAQQKAAEFGLNDVFANQGFNDPYTQQADANNDGYEGLYPMLRPAWDLTDDMMDNPVPVEASPWEYWDETVWSTAPLGQATLMDPGDPCEGVPIEFCNWHIIQLQSNPDMTLDKAIAYQDSIVNYFAPRAYLALDIETLLRTEELLEESIVKISPNPAFNTMNISSEDNMILDVEIFDVQGKLVHVQSNVNRTSAQLDKTDLGAGMFIAKIRFDEGVVTKRIIFE